MAYDYHFHGAISEQVLCNYLRRSITISCEPGHELHPVTAAHVKSFILNIGAKYI